MVNTVLITTILLKFENTIIPAKGSISSKYQYMGGEGAISGMITSLKYNSKLLSKHKQRRKDAFNALRDTSKSGHIKLDFKQLSPEELERFKNQGIKDRNIAKIKLSVFTVLFIIISIVVIIMILKLLGL